MNCFNENYDKYVDDKLFVEFKYINTLNKDQLINLIKDLIYNNYIHNSTFKTYFKNEYNELNEFIDELIDNNEIDLKKLNMYQIFNRFKKYDEIYEFLKTYVIFKNNYNIYDDNIDEIIDVDIRLILSNFINENINDDINDIDEIENNLIDTINNTIDTYSFNYKYL